MNKIVNKLFLTGFFLCGCQNNSLDQKKQSLHVNIHSEPTTLDPRKSHDIPSIHVVRMCFEGLMRKNDEGQPQPAIAESVEILNQNRTYVFHLRESRWSDGTPLTAYDFEETWKTILSPSFPTGTALDFYIIKNAKAVKEGKLPSDALGLKVLDDKTLQVELERPVPYFLNLISSSAFSPIPRHIEKINPRWADNAGDSFVGNGPFKMKSWQHQNAILLEKNPLYWESQSVVLEEIHLTMVEDETTELSMFESGELDWSGSPLSSLPTDALQALKKQNRLLTFPIAGVYYYVFNVSKPPFNNANLRKALALSINRKLIIENITQSRQQPALGYVPPLLWEKKESNYFSDADLVEAKRLFELALKELDLTREKFPTITLSYNTTLAHHVIAQAVQDQWLQTLGIRVRLENKEWKVFLDELAHGQFQVARLGGIANFHDPMSFLETFRYKDHFSNYSTWINDAFCALIERAENTLDIHERETILRQAEAILMEEMPVIPIYFYTGSYLKKPYVKGVYLSDLSDIDLKTAYIESK